MARPQWYNVPVPETDRGSRSGGGAQLRTQACGSKTATTNAQTGAPTQTVPRIRRPMGPNFSGLLSLIDISELVTSAWTAASLLPECSAKSPLQVASC